MSLATLNILFRADTENFEKKLRQANRSFSGMAKTVGQVGSAMSKYITLPLLAIAGAGVKMASEVDASFVKLETHVGLTRETVDGLRESVGKLAGETARSSKELADAMFVVTSSGLRGEKAMSVLEMGAKAAAIGLGETKDITRAVTAIIQAYGKENMTAARATNALIGTVKEGNVAAEDLAPALGRVIGMASLLGISIEEVGANIATFTRIGVKAEEAVVGLRGVMASLLKPTEQSREALATIGMTSDSLRAKVSKQGLAKTLIELVAAFKGNEEGIAAVIPNVSALSDVLGTAGAQAEDYQAILTNMLKQEDLVGEGFKRVSETASFKLQRAMDALKASAKAIGAELLPVVQKIADAVSGLGDKFKDLSDSQLKTMVTIGGILAVTGPLLKMFSSLVLVLPKIAAGFKLITAAIAANPLGLVLTGVAASLLIIIPRFKGWLEQVKAMRTMTVDLNDSLKEVNKTIGEIDLTIGKAKVSFDDLSLKQLETELKTVNDLLSGKIKPTIGELGEEGKKELEAQRDLLTQQITLRKESNRETGTSLGLYGELNKKIEDNEKLIKAANNEETILRLRSENEELQKKLILLDKIGEVNYESPMTGVKSKSFNGQISTESGLSDETIRNAEVFGWKLDVIAKSKKELAKSSVDWKAESNYWEKFIGFEDQAIELTNVLAASIASLGDQLAQGADSWAEYGELVVKSLKQAIAMIIKEGVAIAIKNALITSAELGPFAPAIAALAGGLAAGVFSTALNTIPSLAEGGFIKSPQLIMAGDAKDGKGEWILNSQQMKNLTAQKQAPFVIKGELKARGRELVYVFNNESAFHGRT
jgi:TP901 family phage tail tape measure protein